MRNSAPDGIGRAEGAGYGKLLGQGGEVQDILVGSDLSGPFCALLWLVLIVMFAVSELDRASPLDLWGVFMRVNGEMGSVPCCLPECGWK